MQSRSHIRFSVIELIIYFMSYTTLTSAQENIHHNLPDNLEIIDPKSLGLSGSDLENFLGNVKLLPVEGDFGPKTQILTVGFDGNEKLNLQDFEQLSTDGLGTGDKAVAEMAFKKFKDFFQNPNDAKSFEESLQTSTNLPATTTSTEAQTKPPQKQRKKVVRIHKPANNNNNRPNGQQQQHPQQQNQNQQQFYSSTFRNEEGIGQTTPQPSGNGQVYRPEHLQDYARVIQEIQNMSPPAKVGGHIINNVGSNFRFGDKTRPSNTNQQGQGQSFQVQFQMPNQKQFPQIQKSPQQITIQGKQTPIGNRFPLVQPSSPTLQKQQQQVQQPQNFQTTQQPNLLAQQNQNFAHSQTQHRNQNYAHGQPQQQSFVNSQVESSLQNQQQQQANQPRQQKSNNAPAPQQFNTFRQQNIFVEQSNYANTAPPQNQQSNYVQPQNQQSGAKVLSSKNRPDNAQQQPQYQTLPNNLQQPNQQNRANTAQQQQKNHNRPNNAQQQPQNYQNNAQQQPRNYQNNAQNQPQNFQNNAQQQPQTQQNNQQQQQYQPNIAQTQHEYQPNTTPPQQQPQSNFVQKPQKLKSAKFNKFQAFPNKQQQQQQHFPQQKPNNNLINQPQHSPVQRPYQQPAQSFNVHPQSQIQHSNFAQAQQQQPSFNAPQQQNSFPPQKQQSVFTQQKQPVNVNPPAQQQIINFQRPLMPEINYSPNQVPQHNNAQTQFHHTPQQHFNQPNNYANSHTQQQQFVNSQSHQQVHETKSTVNQQHGNIQHQTYPTAPQQNQGQGQNNLPNFPQQAPPQGRGNQQHFQPPKPQQPQQQTQFRFTSNSAHNQYQQQYPQSQPQQQILNNQIQRHPIPQNHLNHNGPSVQYASQASFLQPAVHPFPPTSYQVLSTTASTAAFAATTPRTELLSGLYQVTPSVPLIPLATHENAMNAYHSKIQREKTFYENGIYPQPQEGSGIENAEIKFPEEPGTTTILPPMQPVFDFNEPVHHISSNPPTRLNSEDIGGMVPPAPLFMRPPPTSFQRFKMALSPRNKGPAAQSMIVNTFHQHSVPDGSPVPTSPNNDLHPEATQYSKFLGYNVQSIKSAPLIGSFVF